VTGIDTLLSSLEFSTFSAVAKTVQGVSAGENANQIFESFLIDQALQVGAIVGLSFLGAAAGALQDGSFFASLAQEGDTGLLGPATDAEQIVNEGFQEEEVLFGQRRGGPTFDSRGPNPLIAGKSLDEVSAALQSGELTAQDLPIQVFRDPGSGKLVSMNTRSLAALSKANVAPVYEEIPYSEVSQAIKNRLNEPTLGPDFELPGPYLPITPSQRDLTIIDVVNRPGYPPMSP
jgi:hypothetical protein